MNKYFKVRVSVRSICISEGKMLFQTDVNDKIPVFATIGGELEPGEKLEERLKLEFIEEAGIKIEIVKYLFVIENFLNFNERPVHSLEHYFLIRIPPKELKSRESHLSFHWIPINEIINYDVKPAALKELIIKGELENVKHIIAE